MQVLSGTIGREDLRVEASARPVLEPRQEVQIRPVQPHHSLAEHQPTWNEANPESR